MVAMNKNGVRDCWNNDSDQYYQKYVSDRALDIIEENPAHAFPVPVFSMIQEHLPDLKGKLICVPSSGDNTAVFGFHLLGARVTSVDLSQRQIDNASKIAERKGWNIEFVCDDSMELGKIESGKFDMVYTSNGVHVWIPDLPKMYRAFHRILKVNGCYAFFETHPMIRPFSDKQDEIKIIKLYEDIGPFGQDVPEYSWRMQDFVNSVIESGFDIRRMEEFHTVPSDLYNYNYFYKSDEESEKDHHRQYDWKQNPWAALPQCFSLFTLKHSYPDNQ